MTAALTSIERLGEDIATLAARLHAATFELLVRLRAFDEQAGWNTGFLSCAHWLQWRTGIDLGAAREKVRVARALPQLPRLSTALQRGEISYTKVRALTRIAAPGNEAQLLDLVYTATAGQVERTVRAWRRCDRRVTIAGGARTRRPRRPRFRGNVAAPHVRCVARRHARGGRRFGARCGAQDARRAVGDPTGAGGARRPMPVSRLRRAALRRAPPHALGGWRRHVRLGGSTRRATITRCGRSGA